MSLKDAIKKASPKANVDRYADLLEELMPKYGIDTPLRQRHFLAQLLHESAGFNAVRENLNYSADSLLQVFPKYFRNYEEAYSYARKPEWIANLVYANRMGNGNVASGDGWRFIGRGLIQTTGKENYAKTSQALFGDQRLLDFPYLLEEAQYAVESACYFWKANNINRHADKNDIDAVTRAINGGLHGLNERMMYFNKITI